MIESLKKKSYRKSLIFTFVLIVFGLMIIGLDIPEAMITASDYVSFETLKPEEIKNQYVQADFTVNFGSCMERYETNTSSRVKKTTHLYYVVWTGTDEDTDYRYMSVKVPVSYEKQMEEMAFNTSEGFASDPVHVVGKIRKLDDKEYKYFVDFFKSAGFEEDEIHDMTLPYYIEVKGDKIPAGGNVGARIAVAIGVLLILWAIYRIIKGRKGTYLKKFYNDLSGAGITESTAESDLTTAVAFGKKSDIKVGRYCVYYNLNSTVPRAIPAAKIMWAYQNTVTHRTNGIKTGTTYNIIFFCENYKNSFTVAAPNEAITQDILKLMYDKYPWVVVGFSDDLKKLFHSDRASFLALRYNTVEHYAVEPGFENTTDYSNI